MIRRLQQSPWFEADFRRQVDWYRDEAGPDVAERFVNAVETTLRILAREPGLGRLRFANLPTLTGIRSARVQRPFHRLLVFYRYDAKSLFAERLIHGARDLPRRLQEPPGYETE